MGFHFALSTQDKGGDVEYSLAIVGDYVFLRVVADDCRDEGYFRADASKLDSFWSSLRECSLLRRKSEFFRANLESCRWTVAIRRDRRVVESSGNQRPEGFGQLLDAIALLIDDSRLKQLSRENHSRPKMRLPRRHVQNGRRLSPTPTFWVRPYMHLESRFDYYANFHFAFSIGNEDRGVGFQVFAWDGLLVRSGVNWKVDPSFRFIADAEVERTKNKLLALQVLRLRPFYEIPAFHGTSWMLAMRNGERILHWKGYVEAPIQLYAVSNLMEKIAEIQGVTRYCMSATTPTIDYEMTMNGRRIR